MTLLLSPATVTSLRALAQRGMPDAFQVLRPSVAQDDEGALRPPTYTVVAQGQGQLMAIAPGSQEQLLAERLQVIQPAAALLPAGTDVRVTDGLSIGGGSFQVVGVGPHGLYEAAVSVLLEARL